MGTQVHNKSDLAGYNPMRDLNEDSNSNSWHVLFGDKNLSNGQYYSGFTPRTIADAHPGYDKNSLKQKMIEHDAIFKNQVYELHRVYRVQRNMMEEVKKNELDRNRASFEPSSSSSHLGSRAPSEDARNWHLPTHPLVDSSYARSTVSGAEIVNSPLSCTKGNNILAREVPFQNGCTSKDFEVLESRPSKVRKKLFDLHLPAEEYIDTDDAEQRETELSRSCSFTPNGEYLNASESRMKLSLGGVAIGGHDMSTSASHSKSSVGLADLNEPATIEDATPPPSINILGHSPCNGRFETTDLSAKYDSGFLGLQQGVAEKPRHGSYTGSLNYSSAKTKDNGREWFPFTYESVQSRGNLSSVSKGAQPDKISLSSSPGQAVLNRARPSGIYFTDRKEDLWKERAGQGLEAPDRTSGYTSNSHLDPVVASRVPIPNLFRDYSDDAGTWTQYAPSWGKPTDSLSQKLASFHAQPSSSYKCLPPSAQTDNFCGDKFHANSSSRLNTSLRGDPPFRNGFYLGSSSGSKDLSVCYSSVGFDHLNGSTSNLVGSENLTNRGLEKSVNDSCYTSMKPAKDVNLNVPFFKSSLEEAVSRHDTEIIGERSKPEDCQAVLPWLKAKPACKIEATNSRIEVNSVDSAFPRASPNQMFGKSETGNQIFNATSASSSHQIRHKEETSDSQSVKKILGFPIFVKPSVSENKAPWLVSSTAMPPSTSSGENSKRERQIALIDINVPCDASLAESDYEPPAEAVAEKALDQNASCVRNFIDLNSCITEDEDLPVPSVASDTGSVRIVLEIDLEAPAVPEPEEDVLQEKENEEETSLPPLDPKPEQTLDEFDRSAAEAIVNISSSCQPIIDEENTRIPFDTSSEEPLLWFADVVTCSAHRLHNKSGKGVAFSEMDDFEAMTLQLPETREEDYMPKPFVPEVQQVEETGTNSLPPRTRRGQTRRGRQRKDFQRDILPGLTSLSRHEVTEDLQTFGGLMKATGHSWSSPLTRRSGTRNGGTRGRRRVVVDAAPAIPSPACTPPLVQQLNNIETGLKDRSLTGWGKTTRRPRRQRCPTGNPPTIPIT